MSVHACLSPLDIKLICLHLRFREFSGGQQHHALSSMLNGGTVSYVGSDSGPSHDPNGRPKTVYGPSVKDSAHPNQTTTKRHISLSMCIQNLTHQEKNPSLFSGSCVASVILHLLLLRKINS